MRSSKKADLSLSVNAIVVFVLAFSMLGVGLYVTNLIRENVGSGITSVVNIQDLKSPPSAEDPITISREVTLKKGKEIKLDIGYYNKNTEEATDARLGISSCISPSGEELALETGGADKTTDYLLFVSPKATIGASEGKGYKVKIVDNSKETGTDLITGSYVCTMVAFNPDSTDVGSLDNPYEEKQFFLNVVS